MLDGTKIKDMTLILCVQTHPWMTHNQNFEKTWKSHLHAANCPTIVKRSILQIHEDIKNKAKTTCNESPIEDEKHAFIWIEKMKDLNDRSSKEIVKIMARKDVPSDVKFSMQETLNARNLEKMVRQSM